MHPQRGSDATNPLRDAVGQPDGDKLGRVGLFEDGSDLLAEPVQFPVLPGQVGGIGHQGAAARAGAWAGHVFTRRSIASIQFTATAATCSNSARSLTGSVSASAS